MEDYKTWLTRQLAELGMTPTELARQFEHLGINQPTVLRMASGATKNPSIGATNRVGEAIYLARKAKGLPAETYSAHQPAVAPASPQVAPVLPLRVRDIINSILELRTNAHLLTAIEKIILLAQAQASSTTTKKAAPLNDRHLATLIGQKKRNVAKKG